MLLELTNETKNMSLFFADDTDIWAQFDYTKTLPHCYPEFVQKYKTFKAYNYAGFFNNPEISSFSTNGVNENGENFKANSFGAQIVSWEFKNVFTKGENILSPNNELIILLLNKNDVLNLNVYTNNQVFTNEFYVGSNTFVENGVIELISAKSGDGIYWKSSEISETYFWFNRDQPYIVKNLPQVLLTEIEYPLQNTHISFAQTEAILQFGGSVELGSWDGIKVTNLNNGKTFTYINNNNDSFIIVNGIDLTVVNSFGENRLSNFTGDFIIFESGNNVVEWVHTKNEISYYEASVDLPQDFKLSLKETSLYPTIQ